jgi:hypothetical protein
MTRIGPYEEGTGFTDRGGGGADGVKAASFVASTSGALSCVFPGAAFGDVVVSVVDLTGVLTSAQTAAFFEGTVTVNGHLQQTAGFPGGNICVFAILRTP